MQKKKKESQRKIRLKFCSHSTLFRSTNKQVNTSDLFVCFVFNSLDMKRRSKTFTRLEKEERPCSRVCLAKPKHVCSLPLDLMGMVASFLDLKTLTKLATCCASLKQDVYELQDVQPSGSLPLSSISHMTCTSTSPLFNLLNEVQFNSDDQESMEQLTTLIQTRRLPNVSRLHVVFGSKSLLKARHDIFLEDPDDLSQKPLFSGLCQLLHQIHHLTFQGDFQDAFSPMSSGLLQAIPAGQLESLEVNNHVSGMALQGFWYWIMAHQPNLKTVSLSCQGYYSEAPNFAANFSLTIRCAQLSFISCLPKVQKLRIIMENKSKIELFHCEPNTLLEVILLQSGSSNNNNKYPVSLSLFEPPVSPTLLLAWKKKLSISHFQVYPHHSSTQILFKNVEESVRVREVRAFV